MTDYKAKDYAAATFGEGRMVRNAFAKTATQVATEWRKRGRADLKTAGRFGAWAFSVKTIRDGDNRIIRAKATYVAETLEFGLTIKGRPLLWIPISSQSDATSSAKNFPGKLVRLDRPGRVPLLRVPGGPPKYWGTPALTMPKKLHLTEISANIVSHMTKIYNDNLTQKATDAR